MTEGEKFLRRESTERAEPGSCKLHQPRPLVTRRDFLIRGKAGAVAAGIMAGTGVSGSMIRREVESPQVVQPSAAVVPVSMRRVTLNIDGKEYNVAVDVRESLWETMNYRLGLSNTNLGCDRGQCGACAVLVDGRAVNGCTLLTVRHGRGQKILTVAGITNGPGFQGLHPVQRAFWLEGGFQCGICTRGFVMSAYALLQTNKNPSDLQIKEALDGNICRCGEYPKILSAVKKAAVEMRGESVSYTAPLLGTGEGTR